MFACVTESLSLTGKSLRLRQMKQYFSCRQEPVKDAFLMAKKIYVGNMSYNTTEEDLRSMFAQYGNVVSANIIMDRETRRPKGFGFVEMEEDSAADAAISQLDGKEIDGRNLRVNEAIAKPRPAYNNNNRY